MYPEKNQIHGSFVKSLAAATIMFAVLFWGLDAYIDAKILSDKDLIGEIFSPSKAELWFRSFVLLLFFIFAFLSIHTISQLKRARDEIRIRKDFFKNFVEHTTAVLWEFDYMANRFTYVSPQCEQMLGYAPGEWTNFESWMARIHKDDRAWARSYVLQKVEELDGFEFTCRMLARDGREVWAHVIVHVVSKEGKPALLYGMGIDVTEQKWMERQFRKALHEKQVLLKEVHHRVKNNMQIIASFISLQMKKIGDEKLREELGEIDRRIKAMAIVHESLYESDNLSSVNAESYIKDLLNSLFLSFSRADKHIVTRMSVDNIRMNLDKLIPCGLIINELASNSLKHAFAGKSDGEIFIGLWMDGRKRTLVVSDDGVGMRGDLEGVDSLGLKIVKALVDQLGGSMKVESSGGTKFTIEFEDDIIKLNCWEYMKCGREFGGSKSNELGVCPAYRENRLKGVHGGVNAGRACWAVAGTLCKGRIHGTFAEKKKDCLTCDFYKLVVVEEEDSLSPEGLILRLREGNKDIGFSGE